MTTSPQFKEAILHNLERLNALNLHVERHATLNAYPQDYAKRSYLRKQKSHGFLRGFFLQKLQKAF